MVRMELQYYRYDFMSRQLNHRYTCSYDFAIKQIQNILQVKLKSLTIISNHNNTNDIIEHHITHCNEHKCN